MLPALWPTKLLLSGVYMEMLFLYFDVSEWPIYTAFVKFFWSESPHSTLFWHLTLWSDFCVATHTITIHHWNLLIHKIVLSIAKICTAEQPEVVNIMFKTVGVLLSLPKAEPRGVQGMSQERSRRQVGDMSWTHTNHKMSGKHTITIKSHEFKHRGQGILHVLFTPCNISLFL